MRQRLDGVKGKVGKYRDGSRHRGFVDAAVAACALVALADDDHRLSELTARDRALHHLDRERAIDVPKAVAAYDRLGYVNRALAIEVVQHAVPGGQLRQPVVVVREGHERAGRHGRIDEPAVPRVVAILADLAFHRFAACQKVVGKPSVPVALNPMGVLSLGLNIGRRAAELTLIDFKGDQIDARSTAYAYPVIEDVFRFLTSAARDLVADRPSGGELLVQRGARPTLPG